MRTVNSFRKRRIPSLGVEQRKRFAVLYDMRGEESVPCGLVVERDGYVEIIAPPEKCFPYRIDDTRRVLMPDGEWPEIGPGHASYFNSVLSEFVQVCAVGYQSEYGDPRPTTGELVSSPKGSDA